MDSCVASLALSATATKQIAQWEKNIAPGFASFPVVWESAKGHTVTDTDGKEYIDMISQFAVVNFGHSHPHIIEAVIEQTRRCALTNTSYMNPLYGRLATRLTEKFGYDAIASMVTGAEAVDALIKIARKWAYVTKGIPNDEAIILTTDQCYHGLTLATMGLSNRIAQNFGKHLPNVGPHDPQTGQVVRFGDVGDLENALAGSSGRIAAVLIEPVQGYAGTKTPPKGYLTAVQDLCRKHNVLFLCDEVQTGFGRTGFDLAYQRESGVKPDMVALGKALTGGATPMSLVMGKAHVMDIIEQGDIVSTFAASPVGCAAALAVLDVLEAEDISARSQQLGLVLADAIDRAQLPYILEHRGRDAGLFQTLVVDEKPELGITARRIAALCALRGVLCGNAANRLRLSPPLVIAEDALCRSVEVIAKAFRDVGTLGLFPGST
ncbi:L-ornithine aminotransferase [Aspergillus candidus]|uniref:Ornithine aminotransferase n=1 Tax=Aspergillus candidus TaxID=41067 RepID=A0A2I2F530_ASPCN|nr:L-ornithine aminotransferase [Aspergillus candidus]PLB35686.1 L-ornithine aminotransferase [Aspergillus candidus]